MRRSNVVTNFWQLLVARIGVGIGEAGGSPPSHSLLADFFPPDKRAIALGLIIGIFGGLGTFLGCFLGDRLGKSDVKWYMLVPAIGFLITVPFGFAVFMTDSLVLALVFYTVPAFLVNLYTGPTFGMTQSLAPLAMRAAASALLLFILNIIGLVLGPTTVGILSDLLQSGAQMSDVESLRYALVVCNFVYIISFFNYWMDKSTTTG